MFSLKVHRRDSRSGRIVSENAYRMICKQVEGGGSEVIYEQPKGSGLFYNADFSLNKELSKEGLAKIAAKEREASKTPDERELEAVQLAKKRIADWDAKQSKKNASNAVKQSMAAQESIKPDSKQEG